MKQLLSQLDTLNEALLGNQPVVLLFVSKYCPACTSFEKQLTTLMESYPDTLYFELLRGQVPGIEATFGLVGTPALVMISAAKRIVCLRGAQQLSLQQLQQHLEETHETDCSLFL